MAIMHRLNYLNPFYTYQRRQYLVEKVGRLATPLRHRAADYGIAFNHNDRFLLGLKNSKVDQIAFVIGNGPSLRLDDLEKLTVAPNSVTFAANKVYLAFDQISFRPSFYFVEDNLVLQQNWNQVNALEGIPKFHPKRALDWAPRVRHAYYYEFIWEDPNRSGFPSFGANPVQGFYWGSTVIYSMIQFACFMGCNPIVFLGVDFSFELPKAPPEGIELVSEGERNHFHAAYRVPGEKWNIPNLDIQMKTFQKIRSWGDANGVEFYNATRGGKLEVFDRVDLDSFLESRRSTQLEENRVEVLP